jgi:predicted RNase H-like nuclease (RuvC/YqgF family)
MVRQLIEYVKQHIHNENIKLKASDWAPKMIQDLWDHMLRLWQYRNDALHENGTKKVLQFKVEAMDRDIERLQVRIEDLRHKLRTFQEEHMQRVEHVKKMQHNSRKFWAALAKIYLDEAENIIETDIELMDQNLQGRSGVG